MVWRTITFKTHEMFSQDSPFNYHINKACQPGFCTWLALRIDRYILHKRPGFDTFSFQRQRARIRHDVET